MTWMASPSAYRALALLQEFCKFAPENNSGQMINSLRQVQGGTACAPAKSGRVDGNPPANESKERTELNTFDGAARTSLAERPPCTMHSQHIKAFGVHGVETLPISLNRWPWTHVWRKCMELSRGRVRLLWQRPRNEPAHRSMRAMKINERYQTETVFFTHVPPFPRCMPV